MCICPYIYVDSNTRASLRPCHALLFAGVISLAGVPLNLFCFAFKFSHFKILIFYILHLHTYTSIRAALEFFESYLVIF